MDENLRKFLSTINHLLLFPFSLQKTDEGTLCQFNPLQYYVKLFLLISLILYCQITICVGKMLRSKSLNEIIFVGCTILLEIPHVYSTLHILIKKNKLTKIMRELELIAKLISKLNYTNNIKNIIFKQAIWLIFIVVYLQTIYMVHYDFVTFLLYHIGYTLPKLFIIISSFTFINFLLQINDYFAAINKAITNRIDEPGNDLLYAYFRLIHLTKIIDKFYGWQNLLHITHYFCWVFYELYHWTILIFLKEITTDQRFLITYATSWITVQSTTLLYILYSCHITSTNGNYMVHLWNQITSKKPPTKFVCLKINL